MRNFRRVEKTCRTAPPLVLHSMSRVFYRSCPSKTLQRRIAIRRCNVLFFPARFPGACGLVAFRRHSSSRMLSCDVAFPLSAVFCSASFFRAVPSPRLCAGERRMPVLCGAGEVVCRRMRRASGSARRCAQPFRLRPPRCFAACSSPVRCCGAAAIISRISAVSRAESNSSPSVPI